MTEVSNAALVLIPLILLALLALYLLRMAMSAGELTDAARQRLGGHGMLLLYLVVVASLVVFSIGIARLARHF
jgi:hypothetical protein